MGRFFKITIFKSAVGGAAGSDWSNSYHYDLGADGGDVTAPKLLEAVNDLAIFERNLHTNQVTLERAVISTVEQDEAGLVEVVRTVGLGQTGLRTGTVASYLLPLDRVLVVGFSATGGRMARNSYRGCLYSTDVDFNNGVESIPTNIKQQFYDNIFASLHTSGVLLELVIFKMLPGDVEKARPINAVSILDIGTRQRHQQKKPKISLDEDSIRKRLVELGKELFFVLASMKAFDGYKDYRKPALMIEALEAAKASAQELADTDISIGAPAP